MVKKLKHLKRGKSKNLGKAFRKTLSNWNYRELLNIIEMRYEENRVSFHSINPYKKLVKHVQHAPMLSGKIVLM
jgi:IS605 OrfB family transposase